MTGKYILTGEEEYTIDTLGREGMGIGWTGISMKALAFLQTSSMPCCYLIISVSTK